MENLQIKGADLLDEKDKLALKEIAEGAYNKLRRKVKNDFILKIVVKEYSKNKENKEKRNKFSIHIEISGFSRIFEADDFGWDLNRALHGAVQKLDKELEHEFRISEQR